MSSMIPNVTEPGAVRDVSSVPEIDPTQAYDGDVTLYLRSSAPDAARRWQRATVRRIEALHDAGAFATVEIVRWPNKVSEPADGPDSTPTARYDEFVEAVGKESLAPFFQERPGVGRLDRVIVLPVICITARRDETLLGVYPRWNDGTHESVEDGLDALASGSVRNV